MIGHELWDRTVFGITMVAIGFVFALLIWDKSLALACVGIANVLFGAYVIWGAFAWQAYKDELFKKHRPQEKDSCPT